MAERLVDVLNSREAVLHTYPVTIGGPDIVPKDGEYRAKAAEAAAYAQLVPNADLNSLTTRMHVGRGGALAPYGDNSVMSSETEQGLDQHVRERAYALWQQDGCPEGHADEYWHGARDQHFRDRAYALWQQEGCPEGRTDEFWHRTCQFETH